MNEQHSETVDCEQEALNLDSEHPISGDTLLALFHRAARFMARSHHRHGHVHHAQGHVLALLQELGPTNQRLLMNMLHVRSASLSELLGKLEHSGHIQRERDPQDRRNYIITLTEQGRTEARTREKLRGENARAIFDPLSEEERQQLGALLIKLIIAMEEDVERFGGHEAHGGRHGHHGGHHERHGGRCRGRQHGREGGHGPHGPFEERGPHGHGPGRPDRHERARGHMRGFRQPEPGQEGMGPDAEHGPA
ncbi:MarR family transcriptional regulator [Desulfovibrio sp. OttesenSCG-928-A18]|nr:MarR family transcriptional regulator [Desulfovibrio sp. OttesenSCG-928-A18]